MILYNFWLFFKSRLVENPTTAYQAKNVLDYTSGCSFGPYLEKLKFLGGGSQIVLGEYQL
jgi:hypothetical protein